MQNQIASEADFYIQLNHNKVLSSFEMLDKLGEGSFGIVYKCRHIDSQKLYAVKFLKVWSVPLFAQKNLIKRFELEFETGQIQSEYLVQTYQIDSFNGIPYFICDYCPLGNLERRIQQSMPTDAIIQVAKAILFGLNDLHRNGKIHRDLKPENILFDNHGRPRLTDFGISGHINIQLTKVNHDDEPSQIFGSYAYMAPEQTSNVLRKNTLLPTVDIFSFGVLVYEMFTKHLPFGDWNHIEDIPSYLGNCKAGKITEIDEYRKDVPAIWKSIIHRCLQSNRDVRFQNVADILDKLQLSLPSDKEAATMGQFGLMVLDGEQPGLRYPVTLTNMVKVGRENNLFVNTINVQEELSSYISKRHATIEHIKGKMYLRDGQWQEDRKSWINSKNGTFLNGYAITERSDLYLSYNDIITIGNTSLKVIK